MKKTSILLCAGFLSLVCVLGYESNVGATEQAKQAVSSIQVGQIAPDSRDEVVTTTTTTTTTTADAPLAAN